MNIKPSLEPAADDCGGIGAERKALLSFDDAVAAALATALPLSGSERLDLRNANGRILSRDIRASSALPRFDHSAMDGFAVRSSDLTGPGPWTLPILRTMAAGDGISETSALPGTALEIYTGAPVPAGFDAVIVREKCRRIGDTVLTAYLPKVGENIRKLGEDVAQGVQLASSGTLISPHVAALLAGSGINEVDIRPRVRVALITTGSELRRPGEALHSGQIYDSNRYMAAGMLSLPWVEFTDLGHLRDDPGAIREALQMASQKHDVVLTSGGMSHSAADHMRTALEACNARLEILNVAMRPGKPATVGRVGRALFIGLPGNPMAAAVVLGQIGLPAIRATSGFRQHGVEWYPAVAGFDYRKREGRTEFLPVKVTGRDEMGLPVLARLGRGSSGSLLPMAVADGLAVLRPEKIHIPEGTVVRYEPFGSSTM